MGLRPTWCTELQVSCDLFPRDRWPVNCSSEKIPHLPPLPVTCYFSCSPEHPLSYSSQSYLLVGLSATGTIKQLLSALKILNVTYCHTVQIQSHLKRLLKVLFLLHESKIKPLYFNIMYVHSLKLKLMCF